MRTARYRLVEWKVPAAIRSTAVFELYDYESDPGENKNLAEEKPEVVRELKNILAEQPEAKPQVKVAARKVKPAKQRRNSRSKKAA